MGEKKVRINPELYEKIKVIAEKSGRSIREVVEESLMAYLLGHTGEKGKEIKGIHGPKLITLLYPSKCRICKKDLKEGTLAYYTKITYTDNSVRSYVVCVDCYYKSSALKEYYLQKRKYEKIIKELKKEADYYADLVNDYRLEIELKKMQDEVKEAIKETYEALDYVFSDNEIKDKLVKVNGLLQELHDIIDKFREVVESHDIRQIHRVRKQRVPKRKYY